jgi:hypothetical protein
MRRERHGFEEGATGVEVGPLYSRITTPDRCLFVRPFDKR